MLRPKRGMGGFLALMKNLSSFAIGEYFSGTLLLLPFNFVLYTFSLNL